MLDIIVQLFCSSTWLGYIKMRRVMAGRLMMILVFLSHQSFSQPFEHNAGGGSSETNRSRIFSPRMDYDEWTPLGRGDPLKNDPTFDYVPPVLDRVQYWLDTQSSTEASSKRDILVLGVTAKKTSPKIPEHFLKFMDGPKYTSSRQDEASGGFRGDFIGSTGAEPPKIIRNTKFRPSGAALDIRNPNRIPSLSASYYPSPFYSEKSKPYTVMMPPPIIQRPEMSHQQFGMQTEETPTGSLHLESIGVHSSPVTARPLYSQPVSRPIDQTTTSSITFDKSNLVYQSSQTFDPWSTDQSNSPAAIIWTGNDDKIKDHFDEDHHAAGSANHEVVIGQNANIIVEEDSQEREQVVLGKKEPNYLGDEVERMGEKMHIVLANMSAESEAAKKVTVAVVMPTNYVDALNNSQRTEETIKTPSTRLYPTASTFVPPWRQPTRFPPPLRVFSRRPAMPVSMHRPLQKPHAPGMMMMHAPISSTDPMGLHRTPLPSMPVHQTPPIGPKHPGMHLDSARPATVVANLSKAEKSPLAVALNSEEVETMVTSVMSTPLMISTTSEAPTVTSTGGFTTDPIFSHYKQPAKPIHGPMYLIIQGHSKVKTYKPSVNKHGVPVERNSIIDVTTSRPISKFEQFVNDNTRVASTTRSVAQNEVKAKEKRVEQDSLLSLVESGFGAFAASPSLSTFE